MNATEVATEDWRDLLRRAIDHRRVKPARQGRTSTLWFVVSEMLAVGSTRAAGICQELGFDPNEAVRASK